MQPSRDISRLIEIMAALRNPVGGCPWDLEQDFRSIRHYTIEEAYEVADAIEREDFADLREELGDLLLQPIYHAQMAKEGGHFDIGDVVFAITEKLIRRHPHVFGQVEAETAGQVLRNWDQIKKTEPGREPGIFGEVPENLPGPLYARKVQRRAATSGFDFEHVPYEAVEGELEELRAAEGDRDAAFHEVGDVLFAGSIGRTDLPGGSFAELERSIRTRLFPLGDDVAVFPGHGPATTIGRERVHNPFVGDAARFA